MVKNIPTIERSTKIRFGKHALDNQAENTIVFNASDTSINASNPNSVYMTPLRVAEIAASNLLSYSASTKEIVDSSVPTSLLGGVDLASAVDLGNTSSNTVIFTNTNETIVSSGTIRSDNFKTTSNEVAIDGNKTNKIQVSGIIHSGDLQATDHVAIANTNPQNKLTIGPLGQTVLNIPNASEFALDTVGNVNAQNYRGDSYYLSNLTMENITNQGNITSNTIIFSNAHNSIFTTSNVDIGGNVFVRNPNDNAIFGNIAGSNTITASKITAGEIIGTTSIEGQNISVLPGGTFQGDGANITNISAENIDTGILDVERGGTNIGTYNTGDMLYASGPTTLATITSSGANDKYLKFDSGSGVPTWMDVASTLDEIVGGGPIGSNTTSNVIETGGLVTGFVEATTLEGNGAKISGINAANVVQYNNNTLSDAVLPVVPETKGGTGQNAYAQGDILYSDNTNSLNRLAKGTDKQILHMNGNVPQWTTTISDATLDTSTLTGSITTQDLDANRIPFIDGGKVLSTNPKLQFDGDDLVTLGSNVEITGNLHVVGNITARHENSLTINDPIIEVGNNNSSDNIDLGMVMTMSTSNVVHGFRGNEKEYTIAYTHSDPVGPDIVPTLASGITNHPYITANVWGNVLSGNVTTTGKVTAGTAIEIASGGTGINSVSENDLLLGPASGTAFTKLAAYVPTASSTAPANMSANSSGGNTASSGDSSSNAYKAFDGSDSTNYVSPGAPATYSSSIPYGYTGSNSLGGVNGEWVKIQLSSAITPTSVFLKARPDNSSPDWAVRPNSWRILGSNDDTSWTQLHSSSTLVDDTNGTTESFTNTTAYSYLAIVVTHINSPGSNDARWTLSRLSFTQPGGVSEKFLKSSATGISWDDTISGDGLGLTALNASNISTGTLTTARGGTGVTTGITVLNPLNLSSQVTMQKGGTGQTYLAENDLLLGPASGDVLSKLSAYTGPASIAAPPSGMSSTTQTIGGIQYTSSASSTYSGTTTYNAFDHTNTTIWRSVNTMGESYDEMDGYYSGASTTGSYNGAWIQLYRATAIAPTSVQIIASQTTSIPAPKEWKIFGSTNGSSWTQIHSSSTGVTWNSGNGHTATISGSAAYNYLRLAVEKTTMTSSMGTVAVSELRFSAPGTGPTEKFLKSSSAGVSWDSVSSTLQAITDGGATTTQTVAFNNTTTGLTSAGDIDIAATKRIDFATDIIIESTAGTSLNKSPLKIINAIEVDPDVVGGGTSSKNVLAINHATGEIYDSGGQGGSTMEFIHEEGTGVQANVSIGRTAWGATTDSNLTINTYGSNVLTISGNVSADNITIGALHVSASPFNLDDVASAGAGANVTSNVLQLTATGNAFVTTNNINVSKDVHTGGNVYSQNLQLTNTQISTTWTTGSGTLEIDCKNKTYGTAPAVSIDADVAILNVTNLPSGGQVVVPLVASGADRKVLKTITAGIDFIAFTADVSIDQNSHGLLTVSKIGASGAEKIYMNAISFTAA